MAKRLGVRIASGARSGAFRGRCSRGGLAAALAIAAGAAVVPASAQNFPSRPVRIVVPYAAGGAVDIVARTLGVELGKRLGQSVVVDNRTGAGGNIGSEFVAKAPPDGHTLLMGSTATAINASLYQKLSYSPATDLVPVGLVGSAPSVLLVAPSFPAKGVKELIAIARAKPGEMTFGSGGSGTSEHLAGELLRTTTGVNLVHVPYKGGNAAMNDIIGGQIVMMFINQLAAVPQVRGGKIRALAVASPERSTALPEVPTMAEQGYPGFNVAVWWGLMTPAGTPREVIGRLNAEVVASVSSPGMQERLATLHAQPLGGTTAEFAAFYADELARWAKVVRASGARAE